MDATAARIYCVAQVLSCPHLINPAATNSAATRVRKKEKFGSGDV
jgi:hypothetical protein